MSKWMLGAILRPAENLRVYLPLQGQPEASFVSADDAIPADTRVLWLSERSAVECGGEELLPLCWTLWPSGVDMIRARLEKSLQVDNRLDMETELIAWSDLLWRLVTWSFEQSVIAPRELRMLEEASPALAHLFAHVAQAETSRSGREEKELFGDLFPPREPIVVVSDDEQWASWSERSEEEILGARGGLSQLMEDGFETSSGEADD